jgi:hypothetical protein
MFSIFKKHTLTDQINDLVKERNKLIELKKEKAIEYIKLTAKNTVERKAIVSGAKALENKHKNLIVSINNNSEKKISAEDSTDYLKSATVLQESERAMRVKEESLKSHINAFNEVIDELSEKILKLQYQENTELETLLQQYLELANYKKHYTLKCVQDLCHHQVGIYFHYSSTPVYDETIFSPDSKLSAEQIEIKDDIEDYIFDHNEQYVEAEKLVGKLLREAIPTLAEKSTEFVITKVENDVYARRWILLTLPAASQLKTHLAAMSLEEKLEKKHDEETAKNKGKEKVLAPRTR